MKSLRFSLPFLLAALAAGQSPQPQVYADSLTADEATKMDAANQLVDSAMQAASQARKALDAAIKARSEAMAAVQLAHGHAIGNWELKEDGSLSRPAHVVEIRGHLLIHTQGTDTCPAENARRSGADHLCLGPK